MSSLGQDGSLRGEDPPHRGGHLLSLQYHKKKDEDDPRLKGEIIFRVGTEQKQGRAAYERPARVFTSPRAPCIRWKRRGQRFAGSFDAGDRRPGASQGPLREGRK